MNFNEIKYSEYALIKEMLETPEIIKNFNYSDLSVILKSLKKTKKLFLTGEGSSRIFPAKNIIYNNLKENSDLIIFTEGGRQTAELDLRDFTVFGASNSGKTKEIVNLFENFKLISKFALTANRSTPLEKLSDKTFILNCGKEDATAATKSVVEQALFYQNLVYDYLSKKITKKGLIELSEKAKKVLEMKIDDKIISEIAKSKKIYFAGRNNGVAEEATLKTNEITRKPSDFLEGTYAVHGIEEIMNKDEVVILIEPFKEEEQKFKEVLVDSVGMNVFAISRRQTIFPTIKIPEMKDFDEYLQLLACWNILVEVGLRLNINLDKPVRARKIGNEIK